MPYKNYYTLFILISQYLGENFLQPAEGWAGHVAACSARLLCTADLICFRLRHRFKGGTPKRTTFGKVKGGKKTKLVQKAAFPSLPSPYGFPLWTLFSLSLSLPSLCRLLTWAQNPSGLLSGLFCLWQERAFAYGTKGSAVLRQQC